MKRTFTHLFTLMCAAVMSLTASAQFQATVEEYPEGYKMSDATFPLTEVAAALSTDTATLHSTIKEWQNAESTEVNYFFLANAGGDPYSDYTQGSKGGFWMTKNPATPVSWAAELGDAAWYNILSVDEEAANLVLSIGQYPGAFAAGEQASAQFLLVFGEKTATFDITLKVIEKPVVDMPKAETEIAKLQVVGQQTVEVRQYPRGGYDSSKQEVDLTGVADLLGTTDDVIAENLEAILYATVQKSTEADAEFLGDSLSNTSTANAIGFWFGRLWDKTNEVTSVECASATWAAGKNLVFFSESYAYDAESKTLTSNIGQKGGELKVGDEMKASIYLIWGEKAYVINYHFLIEEAPVINPDELTEVGSEEIVAEFYVASDYSGTSATIDFEAILALLGAEKSEVTLKATADETGAMTDQASANNGGFWLNAEGYRCSYGDGYFYIEPTTSGDLSSFSIGQYPNRLEAGTVYTAKIYIVAGNKYYTLNLTIKPTEKPAPAVEFESVATKVINIQVIPAASYDIEMKGELDMTEIESLVGTSNVTLYGQAAPQEGDDDWTVRYSDAYSCTPYPGFWMDGNGYVSTWGSSPWGVTYSGGTFTFYQMPNHADNTEGASYKANLFLVNIETGKLVTVEIHLSFVSQIVNADEVGSMDIVLPLSTTKGQHLYTDVDMSKAIEALGVETTSDMLSSTQPLKVTMSDGNFNEGGSASEGAGITADGFLDETENLDNTVFSFYMEAADDNTVTFETENFSGTFEAGQRIKVKAAIEVPAVGDGNAKRYILNILFVDPDTYTGVGNIHSSAATSSQLFDLSGRRVNSKSQKGIYIVDGKKVVVK